MVTFYSAPAENFHSALDNFVRRLAFCTDCHAQVAVLYVASRSNGWNIIAPVPVFEDLKPFTQTFLVPREQYKRDGTKSQEESFSMATPSASFSSLHHVDEFDPAVGAALTQPDLIREGWTKSVITKMLGSPDFTRRRHGGGTFNYYLVERVEAVKASAEFAALIAKSEARKGTAFKALATRIANMEHFAKMVELTIVPDKTAYEIERLAIHMHVANYAGNPGKFHWNNRAARDCIRHTLTNYESLWAHVNRGYTGGRAYEILRVRVDRLVARTYPPFASD